MCSIISLYLYISLRVNGAHIITLALGTLVNTLELRGISSEPHSETMLVADSWRDLSSRVGPLIAATCDGEWG